MINHRILAIISCFIVTVIFSIHFVVAKEILYDHHPLALTTLRGIIGGILIFIIFYKKINWSLFFKHKAMLFFIGFLGFFMNQLFFMTGLKLTSPLNASIITNAVPLVTATLAISFGLELFSFKKFGGILLGFSCVLYLMLSESSQLSLNWKGDLLVFLNMFVFSLAIIFIKRLSEKGLHFAIITASMMIVGGILSSLVAQGESWELLLWGTHSYEHFFMLVFEVLFSTVIAYLLNFYALKHLAPSKITIFIYLQPFITALTLYYMKGELPELSSWGAFLGILLGGGLVLRSKEIKN